MTSLTLAIPAFNLAPFVGDAIQSALAQEIDGLEVLVIDDASEDGTWDAIRRAASGDPRVVSVRNEIRLGMGANWNRALELARGELFLKLDGDDALEPGVVRELAGELSAHPAAAAVFCRAECCDERLRPTGAFQGDAAMEACGLPPSQRHELPGLAWLPAALTGRALWQSSAGLFRTEVLRELGGWDARWRCGADIDLMLRLMERDAPIIQVPTVGVRYRQRPGSVSARFREEGLIGIEARAIALRSLTRLAAAGRLPPTLRRRRVQLWNAWNRERADTPARDIMRPFGEDGIAPPTWRDRFRARLP